MTSRQPGSTIRQHRRSRRHRGWARPAQMALVAMGGVLLIYAQAVTALGVGEPRYLSHLFEPLRVDIPVDTQGVDPAAVKVGISFSGIDPAAAAAIESQLHREWQADGRGGHVLRVSTGQPIHEPLMQMRVEVGDDRIQAIRELTLLFDPAPVETPPPSLLAQPDVPAPLATPAAPEAIAESVSEEPVAIAAEAAAVDEPIAVAPAAPVAAAAVVTAAPAPARAARAAEAPPVTLALAASIAVEPVVTAGTRAPRGTVVARRALLAKPALVAPPPASALATARAAISDGVSPGLTEAARRAQIASTLHRGQALSSVDRWQRLRVQEGDTLDSLAEHLRGDQRTVPLSMVAMLLRWLNPRSFDGIGSVPLVGSEVRFPKPESLAAQLAVSGGVWTVDDVTAPDSDAASTVPPPAFQLLTADAMAAALQPAPAADGNGDLALTAGAALLAAPPASTTGLPALLARGRGAGGGLAASGTLVGGAVLAGLLSMMLMLKMVVTTPVPQASRYVPAAVVARSVSAPAAASAGVLPADTLDLAALDLGRVRLAETVRQRAES